MTTTRQSRRHSTKDSKAQPPPFDDDGEGKPNGGAHHTLFETLCERCEKLPKRALFEFVDALLDEAIRAVGDDKLDAHYIPAIIDVLSSSTKHPKDLLKERAGHIERRYGIQGVSLQPTERYFADCFVERFVGTLRFAHHLGKWFRWCGTHWAEEKTQAAYHDCHMTTIKSVRALEAKAGREMPELLLKASTSVFAEHVEKLARSDPRLSATEAFFDRNPFLLGTPGGTVELRTGMLRAAKPEEGISKVTAVAPADTEDCPRFHRFLDEITMVDKDLARFLKQWLGYNLTGDISEQRIFFGWGAGGNGKGTLFNTFGRLIGAYKRQAARNMLVLKTTERHPTELKHLVGARMVLAAEVPKGATWDEQLLKDLTGGDEIAVRGMRENFEDFLLTCKLTVMGNDKPALRTIEWAIRRRFLLVPFLYKPDPNALDLKLDEKLKAEWPGILRLCLNGCLDWQNNGLVVPESVEVATKEYFASEDVFAQWFDDCCVEADQFEPIAALYRCWRRWVERTGLPKHHLMTERTFGDLLVARNFPRKRTSKVRGHRGLRIEITLDEDLPF